MNSRTACLWLTMVFLAGLLTVGGCTRDKPTATPTPTAPAELVLATPSPALSATVTREVTYHTVQAGETAWTIADRYGITLEDLVAANELADPDRLQPGQQLVIPDVGDSVADESTAAESGPVGQDEIGSQRTHIVVAGETLWSIAEEYGTTVDDLSRVNDLDPEGILAVGQELLLP